MKLGISSWTFPWAIGVPGYLPDHPMTALGLLDRAAELGVRVVQIADNLPLAALPPSGLERLAQHAASLAIGIEVGTRGIAPENLRTHLRLARHFRSPIVRVVVDTKEHRPSPDDVVAILRPLLPEFEQAGVCLAIENHDRFKARMLARILGQLGSRSVGVCLDTANSFGALEGPDVVVKTLGSLTLNLHVKDFAIRRSSSNMGFVVEGCAAGQGMLDVPWLLKQMVALRRDPNAIIELWTPSEPDLHETINKEAAWAQTSVQYLRQLIPD